MLILSFLSAGSVHADGRVSDSLHPCAEDSGGVGSCTANEINIAEATEFFLEPNVNYCKSGHTVHVSSIDAEYGLNTGVRYDPLLWIGQKGNDPRDPDPNLDPGDDMAGSCYVTSAPAYPDLISNQEEGEDEDSCLDISNPDLPSVTLPYSDLNFKIQCQDADDDGIADVHVLVTWIQNTNLLCGNGPDEVFGTGAPPKCNYNLISLNIPYVTSSLTVTKVIDSDDGGSATLADFDVSVDAVEVDWVDPASTTGETKLVKNEADTYTLSEADVNGYTEGVWSCMDDDGIVPVTNGGLYSGADVTVAEEQHVTCSITNSDDPPSLTLLKYVNNDNGGDAEPGDFQLRLDGGIYDNAPFSSGASPPVVAGTTYTLSEDAFPGYSDEGVICFDEDIEAVVDHPVTLALGQSVTCTITNVFEVPQSLTITKVIESDNGGSTTLDDFDVSVDAVEVDWTDPDSTTGGTEQVKTEAGIYTLSEAAVNGYTEGVWLCMDDDGIVPVTNGGAFDGADVEVEPGQHVTCSITNSDDPPYLTVIKHVVNEGGGTAVAGDWTMDVTAENPSSNNFPGAEAPGTTITIDAGDYSMDESGGPGGYEKSLDAGCMGTLALGESATCTITNTFISDESLTITKVIDSDGGGSAILDDFDVSVDAVEVDWADPNSTTGETKLVKTEAGTYTLSEIEVDDYDPGAWSCSDVDGDVPVSNDGLFSGANVTVDPGQHVTCSITNTFDGSSLTIIKVIDSDGGGNAILDDFNVSVDAVEVDWADPNSTTGGTRLVATLPGTYTLSESAVADYDPGAWSCSDADGDVPVSNDGLFSGADVTVDPGQDVICSITNTFDGPPIEQSLTITKVIDSDGGGSAVLSDFDVSVNAVEVDWTDPNSTTGGTRLVATLPDTYTLSERAVDDYEAGAWSCSDADGEVPVSNGGLFSGADVTVDPNQHVSCSIINDFSGVSPTEQSLTVTKVIKPGGGATLADFYVSVNGVEIEWTNPASTTLGTERVADLPGDYILSESKVNDYDPGSWSCNDADGYVPVSNGGLFSGAKVTVAPNQNVSCSITNYYVKTEFSVEQIVCPDPDDPDIDDCPVYIGQKLDICITVGNEGSGTAEGVILDDHWSWQLKLANTPDAYECIGPKSRWLRCKLGNLDAGASEELAIGFSVGGHPGELACNLAKVSTYPVDDGDMQNQESELCFDLVGKLTLGPDDLQTAIVGLPYEDAVEISGGVSPYAAQVNGLPEGFDWEVKDNEILIRGCSMSPGSGEFSASVSDDMSCQDTSTDPSYYHLTVEDDPDCPESGLIPLLIPQDGIRTSDPKTLPDESIQKVAVDADRNRYLVGYSYREHAYATDPNGPFVQDLQNYDIRVVKYDDAGDIQWDKTYDTGNDDYGYAISLAAPEGRQRLYVGGSSLVETGPQAWRDAILLEIDPATGCPVGEHFQSASKGTISAWYDIASNGTDLYAVGEVQRNEKLSGEFGALISIFSHGTPSEESCEGDHHIISDTDGDELTLERNIIREGEGVLPTVAYSVAIPGSECDDCSVIVGGKASSGGWVDAIVNDDQILAPFLPTQDFSVQDMALLYDRVILVGSTPSNVMMMNDVIVLEYDEGGQPLRLSENPQNLGPGRLRGVATDSFESIYAVGISDDEETAGLLFKFNAAGELLQEVKLEPGDLADESLSEPVSDIFFNDIAVFVPGLGVIAGQYELPGPDLGWLQVDFCGGSCPSAE